MNLEKLINIDKILINNYDISKVLSISLESARVTASRYVKKGLLLRIKRDLYIPPQKFNYLKEEDLFSIASILQTPSYISLTSALSYYNLTTQQTQKYIESIGIRRTITLAVKDAQFHFMRINKNLYCGFERIENFFIAMPEKALADSIYLSALGKYNSDFDAIDFDKISAKKVSAFINKTNKATKNLWQKLMRNYKL
jgi:hypothetical protein